MTNKEKRDNMKIKKIALKVFILAVIIFMYSSNIIFAEKFINVTRISGSDRYDTSIKISEEINNNGIISIASGEHFADALS
ncbi:cell wall-binding repeat-containing protein, partial [Peptostreptococcus stomatis]|uniref:cell wall-binding repeat-containing protein n=1 Tax=Peptostreptococcus stomatis TaxID=341694 RepID=UPI0028EE6DF5